MSAFFVSLAIWLLAEAMAARRGRMTATCKATARLSVTASTHRKQQVSQSLPPHTENSKALSHRIHTQRTARLSVTASTHREQQGSQSPPPHKQLLSVTASTHRKRTLLKGQHGGGGGMERRVNNWILIMSYQSYRVQLRQREGKAGMGGGGGGGRERERARTRKFYFTRIVV